MKDISTIVFDFDGTISDSVLAMFEIVNELSESIGYKKIKNKDFATFRKKSTEEMITELEIPRESIPKVLEGIHIGLAKRANSLMPVGGMAEVLSYLAKSGYKMFIITSNTRSNVLNFLRKFNINYFNGIYPKSGLYGKSNLLNKLIHNLGIDERQVIFIGDEVRDIEAGRKTGTKTVAVTWGLNGRKVLLDAKPDWLTDTPKQLMKIFK